MLQCQQCKKEIWPWRKCPERLSWYSPSDIRFCPNQMIWLMEHLQILAPDMARWPTDPADSGYYGTGRGRQNYKGAYFESPISYHAEVTWRLDQCGKDGELAFQHWVEGKDEETLADEKGVSVYKLRRRLQRVLVYISGYNRKDKSYYNFIWLF